MLRGDEVGALLGAHLLARGVGRRTRCFANSIVSSRLLAAHGGRARACATRRPSPGSSGSRACPGCATATRRRSATASTRRRCRTRTASARPCCSRRWRRACGRRAAPCSTCWTTSPSPTGCTPPTRSRSGWPTCPSSVQVMDRLRATPPSTIGGDRGRAGPTTSPQGSPALPPTDGLRYQLDGRQPRHRAAERHRAEAQGLPRGHRAGAGPPALAAAGERPARGWPPSATPCMV